MNSRQHGIFMYFNLQKSATDWMMTIEVDHIKDKYLRNKIIEAKEINEKVLNQIERILKTNKSTDYAKRFEDDAEVFSMVLELIRKEPDVGKKQTLYLIMQEFVKGQLKVIEDERRSD